MAKRKQTPKQTETPPETVLRKTTAEDFAEGFDLYVKQIAEKKNYYAEPEHQSDRGLAKWYLTYEQTVENWRGLAQRDLKNCPTLPDVPPLIADNYLSGLKHLETCCKSCAAILRGKAVVPPSKNAEIVFDLLDKLPPYKALTVPEILDAVSKKHGKAWDEKELYDRVFPQLRPWGLENKPRIGYWIKREKSADAPS